ncbi:MAG: VOC family protein, partial [Flavobacterium sp.]
MELPDYYLPIMPYIIVDDSTAFLAYMKRVFSATELMIVPDDKDPSKIMHGELKIQDAVIMFANSTEIWKEKTSGMFLIVEDVDRIYNAGVEQG